MTGRSRLSRSGLDLIKSFEGFRESATRLADGRWIVGYGHVRTAREGVTISEADAEGLLRYDLKAAEEAVSTQVFTPLNQNQFDALVSLVFNISPRQFENSDILRALNAGDYLVAAAGFDRWRKARINGRVMIVDALVRRRAVEKALFLDHPDGRTGAPTSIVPPELDGPEPADSAAAPAAARAARHAVPDNDAEPLSVSATAELPDIAEAIRHIAEQVGGAAFATRPLFVPDADIVEQDAEPAPLEAEFTEPAPEPKSEAVEAGPTAPPPSETLDEARRAMAERVARILERAEKTVAEAEAVVNREQARTPGAPEKPAVTKPESAPPSPPPSPEARLRAIFGAAPAGQASEQPAATRAAASVADKRSIPEDLPDFDAELRGEASNGSRRLIDDTEVFNPGRDPAELFAEGVREEKIVNGHAKRLGPIAGRAVQVAPWIAILVLSVIGLAVGLVESFRGAATEAVGSGLEGASAMLAVFGVMLVMGVYFIVTRPLDPKK